MLVVVAPGQGSQTPGFLGPWLEVPGFADRMHWLSAVAGIDLVRHGTESDADTIQDTAVAQPLLSYGRCGPKEARAQSAALLERAGLPREFADRYLHQLSGGQRQRVGIARAIGLEPSVVIADEIVSGLDVSVQAQILDLLRRLRDDTGMGLVLISHDLSVVRMLCDRVVVMRRGSVVESGRTKDVFQAPTHAYTRGLLRAIPLPDVDPDWLDAVETEEANA